MRRKLILFGVAEVAQIAKYYFDIDSNYRPVCFTVDAPYIKESSFEGLPVVPFQEITKEFGTEDHHMFVALSYGQMNKLRAMKYAEAKACGYKIVNYVSSKCTYLSQHKPGENCFIFEDTTVQPFVKIGNNVTIWSGAYIGHHSVVEDHNFIGAHAGIAGHCYIESYCFLGTNSTINHKIKVASETLVGAGAVIAKNTEFQSVWAPTRSIMLDKKSDYFKL